MKKCVPTSLLLRCNPCASLLIEIPDVLVAKMVLGGQSISSWEKRFSFRASFSGMASITMSVSCVQSDRLSLNRMLCSAMFIISSLIKSFRAIIASWPAIFRRATSKISIFKSCNTTLCPAWANTCAIPLPIIPEPTTKTFTLSPSSSQAAKLVSRPFLPMHLQKLAALGQKNTAP